MIIKEKRFFLKSSEKNVKIALIVIGILHIKSF